MKYSLFMRPLLYLLSGIVLILWVFFLGFIIGQGNVPQKQLPFIKSFLKEPSLISQNTIIPVTEKELTYSNILQDTAQPLVIPEDSGVVQKKQNPTIPKISQKSTIDNVIDSVIPSSTSQTYSFSLQLLALKDKAAADMTMKKLHDNGISTELVQVERNSISWFRLYTTFTGTVKEYESFKDSLANLGIVDTLLRERTLLP
ncbi:MAG: SPOR domain-containing protein [Desulfovibrionaceae bacterium]